MSKHDLRARPIYHHTRDSIEAHLSIVFAAIAVSHSLEQQTVWSIKKFVRTARRYHKAGRHLTQRPRQNPRQWCALVDKSQV
jgi:hypothetical protein